MKKNKRQHFQELLAKRKPLKIQVPDVLSAAFDSQLAFIKDPSRFKAAIASRRSGKSYAIGIYLLYVALNNPTVKCLYYCGTLDSAKNVLWLHIIKVLLDQFKIAYQYNKTLQEVTFLNGSMIKLTGASASDSQIERALGGKYKLVIFDEAQLIGRDLEHWVKYRLGPAMADERGTMVLVGTAGNLMGDHFWYRVTKTDSTPEPGWSVHRWRWNDNKYTKSQLEETINTLKANDALAETRPAFRQEYLCEWVVETESRIYKFNPFVNSVEDEKVIKSLLGRETKWRYIFGMDFGYEDDTALVVGAFYIHDPNCYIVDTFKKPKMLTQEVAELINEWKAKYNPVFIVGDAQNKTLIETLREQYRIPIVPAKKLGKEAHIATMNSDFVMGKIKVIERNNMSLIKEWDELIWAEKKRMNGIYIENPTKDNHAADACLYLHHFSKHYRATPEPPIDPNPRRTRAENSLKEQQMRDNMTYHDDTMGIYESWETAEFVDNWKRNDK